MINFYSETDFFLANKLIITNWIMMVIDEERAVLEDISCIFCDDVYLHKLNLKHLQHDTYTDIISFDYSVGKRLSGDIFISIERVKENAEIYQASFLEELHRVLIHGILHLCGYKDKTKSESKIMRKKENHYLELLSRIK